MDDTERKCLTADDMKQLGKVFYPKQPDWVEEWVKEGDEDNG